MFIWLSTGSVAIRQWNNVYSRGRVEVRVLLCNLGTSTFVDMHSHLFNCMYVCFEETQHMACLLVNDSQDGALRHF